MWIQIVLLYGKTVKQCRSGLFQDSDFAGDLEDSKNYIRGNILRFLEVIPFVPISWMCKKQTSFSHSSTESGTHLIYGIWSSQFFTETHIRVIKNGETRARTYLRFVQHLTNFKSERNLMEWFMIWIMLIWLPWNVNSSRQEALLYVFEDNEVVINIIIKARSLKMRHVSRTHRVALDWLFDRINLDSKIHIKYIDTKNHLADILTKGNFTRDEWNHLLCLFNISQCLCLQFWKYLYSWEIPLKRQGIISRWNRCSTCLKSWQSDNQMRFLEWLQLTGKILHGKQLSLLNDEEVINLSHAKIYVFSNSCHALGRWIRTQINQILFGKSWLVSRVHHSTELWTESIGESMEFEWNIWQDSRIAALQQIPRVLVKNERRTRKFTGRIFFLLMFNDISWRSKNNEQECEFNANFVFIYARRFPSGRWSLLGPGPEKKWYSSHGSKPQGEWDRVAELMMIKFAESGHPVFRVTSPLSRGTLKSKWDGKLSIHFCTDKDNDGNCFSQFILIISSVFSSVSTEQSQICVKNVKLALLEQDDLLWQDNLTHCFCQVWGRHLHLWPKILYKKIHCKFTKNEWKGCHNKIVWLRFVLMQDFWQQLRADSTSWQKTMKSSHNSQIQWHVVSTLCQEMKTHLNQKVGFWWTLRLDPYWRSQPVVCKVNMQWKLKLLSLKKDNSHSCVRISHELNKMVTDLSNQEDDDNKQETSEMKFEEFALKTNVLTFASQSKTKAKHHDVLLLVHLQELYLSVKDLGLMSTRRSTPLRRLCST